MLMDKEKKGDVLILALQETRLDALAAVEFKAQVGDMIESGERTIILDLAKVDFIDSSGLGALVSLLKHAGREGSLAVAGLQKATESMFQLTRMDKVFTIYPNVPDALAKLGR